MKSTFTFEMWLTMYVRLATVRLMNGVLYYLQIPNGSLSYTLEIRLGEQWER